MKYRAILAILAVASVLMGTAAWAEEAGGEAGEEAKAPTGPWSYSLSAGLNYMQSAYQDWATDDQAILMLGALMDGQAVLKSGANLWTTKLHTEYSLTKSEGEQKRKASDVLELKTEYGYSLVPWLEPFASGQAKTQLDDGFTYFDGEVSYRYGAGGEIHTGDRALVNRGFDPLTIEEKLGIRYIPVKEDHIRLAATLSLTGRHLSTDQFYLVPEEEPEDGVWVLERVEPYDELGGTLGLEGMYLLSDAAKITAEAAYFVPFDDTDMAVTTAKAELSVALSKFLSMEAVVELLDDPNISDKLQLRESVMFRLSVKIL